MKKKTILSIGLCAALCLSLTSCGSSGVNTVGSVAAASTAQNQSGFDLDDYKNQVTASCNEMFKDAKLVSAACDMMDIMWSLSPQTDSSLAISSIENAFGDHPDQVWKSISDRYKANSTQYFKVSDTPISGEDAEAISNAYRTYFCAYTSLYTSLTAPPETYQAFASVYKEATDDYNNSLKTLSDYLDIDVDEYIDDQSSEPDTAIVSSSENSSESDAPAVSSQDVYSSSNDKVEVKAIPAQGEDGIVCVFVTNNSDVTIDELEVQINYKDESGTIIDMDSDGHDMVLPNSTVVSRMDAPDTYADFEIETNVELGEHPTYINHAADVEVNSNQSDECVIVEIKNNSDVTIEEIEYIVVFYKNDQLVTVDYPQDVYDVPSGEKVIKKVSTYGCEYDRFEVYLNQAHTF